MHSYSHTACWVLLDFIASNRSTIQSMYHSMASCMMTIPVTTVRSLEFCIVVSFVVVVSTLIQSTTVETLANCLSCTEGELSEIARLFS